MQIKTIYVLYQIHYIQEVQNGAYLFDVNHLHNIAKVSAFTTELKSLVLQIIYLSYSMIYIYIYIYELPLFLIVPGISSFLDRLFKPHPKCYILCNN